MNNRERFVAYMTGQPVDRRPFYLFWGPWQTTWERWQREGIPSKARESLGGYFQSEEPPAALPVRCGPWPAFPYQVIAEDDQYKTWIDSWGIKRRNPKHSESMSQFLEFPVKDPNDWEQYKRERLNPDDPARLAADWREAADKHNAQGRPIQLGYFPDVGIFGTYRWLLGDEECLIALYTMPDLAHEIMDHMTSVYLSVFEKVLAYTRVDVIHLWEDMCGRQGPLISPEHFREFMLPCYKRIKKFADDHDIPLISVDTDGQPEKIIPPMMDGGVNWMFPFEVAAGADVNYFRKNYPGLAILGGIDKRALAKDREAIDAEIERIRPALDYGAYIPELDHLVPDDVPWANYEYYATQLRKLVLGG